MKYFWCALALLVAVGVGCYLATARVGALTDETAQKLEAAYSAAQAGDMSAARIHTEAAEAIWQSHEGFWGTVLRHAETDELSYRFAELCQRAEEQNREELLCGIAELRAMLRHLADMERPYYYNFL